MLEQARTPEQMEAAERERERVYFGSHFNFLNAHRGLRPGNLHGIIGPMGSGKSSLVKAMLAQTAYQKSALVWITEEDVDEYQVDLKKYGFPSEKLGNIQFVQEKRLPTQVLENEKAYLARFRDYVAKSGCEVLFIDNVTTGRLYDGTFQYAGQVRSVKFLANLAKHLEIPVIYVAHTQKTVTANYHRLLEPEDIKGPAQLPIESQFVYLIHKFTEDDRFVNLVRVAKHRGYPGANGFYRLVWKHDGYRGDVKLKFEGVKAVFKSRDRV